LLLFYITIKIIIEIKSTSKYRDIGGALMKRINKILFIIITLVLVFSGSTFAASQKFIVTKEMLYENKRSYAIKSGFVEVMIGNTNFTRYQKDISLTVTPEPDKYETDEYGNMFAYYAIKNYIPGQQLKITVKREIEVSTFEVEIPRITNTQINDENKLYTKPQTRIESDNDEIIKKAEELTEAKLSDYRKAMSIFEYVNMGLTYDTSEEYANKGALSAYENQKGVCEEFATLFAALCRASGIPTRVIEGYRLDMEKIDEETGKIDTTNHVWAEIYLKDFGWLPVEPTVLYLYNGERKVYLNGFCKLADVGYVTIGTYNYDKANRTMYLIDEVYCKETIVKKVEIPEREFKFVDITERYNWSLEAIKNLYNLEIVNGYDDNEYRPYNNITRIEFMAMLSRMLTHLETPSANGGGIYYYPDYSKEHWSKQDYDLLMRYYQAATPSDIASYGYKNLASVFDSSLNLDKPITRAEAVALMDAFMKKPAEGNVFSDIERHKFYNSILKSYSNNLIIGYPDGTFRPNNTITRAEIAVLFDRYINSTKININNTEEQNVESQNNEGVTEGENIVNKEVVGDV
jgi:transglutaminase-like putative cysteine protease